MLDGWQIAGVFLMFIFLSPALVTGSAQDWSGGLGLTLLASPLLGWLLIPLRHSDDLFDGTARKRAELVDVLALVLLWTWPCTCIALIVAIGRGILLLQRGGL